MTHEVSPVETALMPSLTPHVNSLSENAIFTLPTFDFDYRSGQIGNANQKIPRTNEAAWRVILSPDSAQNNNWFAPALLSRSRKYMNEHSEQARAPHTNGPRDVPRCGALSLLQKTAHYRAGG
jgi:hypothetical protein